MILKSADLLREACDPKDLCGGSDIDQQLSDKDLVKEFEKICPICPTDESAILETYANPAIVKVVNIDDKYFVEASDLYKYMEYADITNEATALNNVIKCNEADAPEMGKDNLVLVLPSEDEFAAVSESVGNTFASRINTLLEMGVDIVKRNSELSSLTEGKIREKLATKGGKKLAADLVKHSAHDKEKMSLKYDNVVKSANVKKLKSFKKTIDAALGLFNPDVMQALKDYSAEERKSVTSFHNFLKSTLTKVEKEIAKLESQK